MKIVSSIYHIVCEIPWHMEHMIYGISYTVSDIPYMIYYIVCNFYILSAPITILNIEIQYPRQSPVK